MQCVCVVSTIPATFNAAAADFASAVSFACWSFPSLQGFSLPWSTHSSDAGFVIILAEAFVVPGRTRKTSAHLMSYAISPPASLMTQDSSNYS
ncbi:hypothetical protein MRX96_024581 [Rhipicephalus microplus]